MFIVSGIVFFLGSNRSWFALDYDGTQFLLCVRGPPDALIHVRSLPGRGPKRTATKITRAALSILLCWGRTRTQGKKSGRCTGLLYCAPQKPPPSLPPQLVGVDPNTQQQKPAGTDHIVTKPSPKKTESGRPQLVRSGSVGVNNKRGHLHKVSGIGPHHSLVECAM